MSRDKTVCPKCKNHFSIEKNRRYQIKFKHFIMTPLEFWEAIKQFHYFNHVKCPVCHNSYISREARLFYVFKSPFKIYFIMILFEIALIVWTHFDFYKQ
jgi:hypothetical protein